MIAGGFIISVNLLASLQGSDYIIIPITAAINGRDYMWFRLGVRRVVSEGIFSVAQARPLQRSSLLIVRTARIMTRSMIAYRRILGFPSI